MKENRLINLIQLYELIESCTTNVIVRENSMKAIICENSSWPNMIYEIDTRPANLEDSIKTIQHKVSQGNLPAYCMFDAKDEEKKVLEKFRSISSDERYWNYMEYDLIENVQLPTLTNFEIQKITSDTEIIDWVKTIENSLMKGRKLDATIFHQLNQQDGIELYLGYENGIPVAGSMLFKKEDIAGVYMVGTLKKFQQKGYGSAVTQYVLKRGFELNCKKAVLQATQAGEKIYSKLGFTIEGRIELFDLRLNR